MWSSKELTTVDKKDSLVHLILQKHQLEKALKIEPH